MLRSTFKMPGLLLTLGLLITLGLPVLAQASHPLADEASFTVRREVSDQAMFGKRIASQRETRRLAMNDTQAAPRLSAIPSRLRIPVLGVDSTIESVGLRNGLMDVPGNIWNVSWLDSSPWPGEMGNAVLAGHKDSTTGEAVFTRLSQLGIGDKIYVSDANGLELTFEVIEIGSYFTNQAPLLKIFGPATERRLNLITCDGSFLPQERSYDQRLVVYTQQV